ncbi:MAG TPA: bifunctional UDP-N-acetylglucosamine diphosphorylase/glucosamine-1-phosphate N-acetyltransferase GlmU [Candidatus Baltobacteraceae bacterium]|jgi:bifunctional UDP-N-acetylglucosamine pyrophosphorylase/glucosamine-1-phosphate N-acetyltransferase|nr:bifunctional UDP-N-acetylglucosamine diphosphorylase/glucosamine-1-phosphate N-acetyltransferase GlmU [Candidatus Baltobacteraceae bacterium]
MRVRAIVLAAGKGTRMKSATTKVLHELCGRPMLWWVLQALREAGITDILVVTNTDLQQRIEQFGVQGVVQDQQLGTGHAVQIALKHLPPQPGGRIIVAYGDMPLVHEGIFREVIEPLVSPNGKAPALAMISVRMPLPSNFGRVIRNGANVSRIVEARDATPEELAVDEMNAGIYAFDEAALREAAGRLRNENAQREYYLTDTIEDFVASGHRVVPVLAADHRHVLGINDRVELAIARKEMNQRLCAQYMRDGVTIIDPDTTYLEPELQFGRDTVIYPNTSIGRLSEIGERCVIGPNARLSNARIGARVEVRESVIIDTELGSDIHVGPFAHLRSGTVLADRVHIGNFVEVKNSRLDEGVKAGHLTYLGDTQIGDETNVGAGTITCNYDGVRKNRTTIGRNVFIGSNSSLIAPLTIGDGAMTGASSVVTKDVPPGERVAGNPARPLPKKT